MIFIDYVTFVILPESPLPFKPPISTFSSFINSRIVSKNA